jgi:hypothetical protein
LQLGGFPAYVVRTTTGKGDVYRVRVGAFGNREAALTYAKQMPLVGGSRAIPALAESIPQGIMPFAAALRTEVRLTEGKLEVLPWNSTIALRAAPLNSSAPSRYFVVNESDVKEFSAFQAMPGPDGSALAIRSLALWPSDWESTNAGSRQAYRLAIIELVAQKVGLPLGTVEASEVVPDSSPPYLIVLERIFPEVTGEPEILALGNYVNASGAAGIKLIDGSGVLEDLKNRCLFSNGWAPKQSSLAR